MNGLGKKGIIRKYVIFDTMTMWNKILTELKDVPPERLEEVYNVVHSLSTTSKKQPSSAEKILSFAGSFSDIPEDDYNDFVSETIKTRAELFERDIEI